MDEAVPAATAPSPTPVDPVAAHVVKEWQYQPSPIIACRFEPLGRFVFAGAQDNRVLRLNLETGEFVPLVGHDSWVRAFGFSPDGARCWSGGYDGRLIEWEVAAAAPQPVRTLDAHRGWIRSLSVRPDGKQIATGGNDLLVKVWDSETGSLQHTLSGHDRHVYSVLFAPDGQTLFSGDLRGVIKRWNVADGSQVASFEAAQLFTPNPGQGAEYGGIRSLGYVPEQNQLICAGLYNGSNPFGAVQDPLVVVLECEKGATVRIHSGKEAPKAICWRAIRHPQDFIVGGCGGSAGGFLCFWKPDAETEYHRFPLPNILLDLDMYPSRGQLVSAHYDRHLRLISLTAAG